MSAARGACRASGDIVATRGIYSGLVAEHLSVNRLRTAAESADEDVFYSFVTRITKNNALSSKCLELDDVRCVEGAAADKACSSEEEQACIW